MHPIALLLLLFAGAANAQEVSTNSNGDYAMDLGQVHGRTRAAKMLKEICSARAPDQAAANTIAFQRWRSTYLPFVQEMEKHYSSMIWKESGGEPKAHLESLRKSENAFGQYQVALEQQLLADGQEAFTAVCASYSAYLESPRMNLERYYHEQVQVARSGPGGG